MTTDEGQTEDDAKVFVSDEGGPDAYVGFFEDDGSTGYLYISDRRKREVVEHLQIYTDSPGLNVDEKDVRVIWSHDGTKCAVVIWGGIRGVIDLANSKQGRAFMDSRNTPPISDMEWLAGFDGI